VTTTRSGPALLAAAAGAAFLHGAASLRLPLGAASDDALHLLLARNLLAGGFAVPGPGGVPVTDPLPGWPALMALPLALLDGHWGLLRLFPLAAAALLVWASWRLARRALGEEAALFAAGAVALDHALIGWAGVSLPDILYAALSVLALSALLEAAPPRWAVPAAALAALLRPHGALLLAAFGLGGARRWGARRGAGLAAAAALPLGLWLLRNALAAGSATDYARNAADQAKLLAAWSTLPAHAWKLVGECFGRGVLGCPPGPVAGVAGLALLLACAHGARLLWRKKEQRALLEGAGAYLLLLALLHLAWRPWQSRYCFTVLPFAAILLLAAMKPLLETRKPLAWMLLGLLAVPGLSRGFGYAFEGLALPKSHLWPRSAAWLAANAARDDRVVALEPYLATLLTRREAAFPRPAASRAEWLDGMRTRRERWVFLRGREARNYLSADAAKLMRDFDAWAVPEPPLSAAFSDKEEGVLILRLD
jgi:hypothetical protein